MAPTQDKIAALVQRLRDEQPATQDMNHTAQCDVMEEAAAALVALQARVAELEGQDAMIGAASDIADARPPMTLELATIAERDMWRDRAEAAKRRVAELEDLLENARGALIEASEHIVASPVRIRRNRKAEFIDRALDQIAMRPPK